MNVHIGEPSEERLKMLQGRIGSLSGRRGTARMGAWHALRGIEFAICKSPQRTSTSTRPKRKYLMSLDTQPTFIANALALDFLNTAATAADVQDDLLRDGAALLDWVEHALLMPQPSLSWLREDPRPEVLDGVARKVRGLREWFRSFVVGRIGRSLTADDMQAAGLLNEILARDHSFTALVPKDDGDVTSWQLQVVRRSRSPSILLVAIAELLAQFLCEEDFASVKTCQGPGCTLLFTDRTRGGTRRWCSMAMCGNRAKQATHRDRVKDKG